MTNVSRFALIPLLAAAAAGCSGARGGASPQPDERVSISVLNRSRIALLVEVCPASACLPPRRVAAGGHEVFLFQPRGNSARVTARVVQTAERADADRGIVEQRSVEYGPGEYKSVVFNVFDSNLHGN